MTHTHDDGEPGNYYLPCGCWSGQSDHTCRVGGWRRPDGCHCGAPDDCYCHESCGDDETKSCAHCYTDCQRGTRPHVWDDGREGQHCRWCYTDRADTDTDYRDALRVAAIRDHTAGMRPRVLTVQAYDGNGEPWQLTNGRTTAEIRPREVTGGETRVAAYRLARMIAVAVPDIASVQIWDTASGSNVWQYVRDNGRGRDYLCQHTGRDRDGRDIGTGDPVPIGPAD